MNRHQSITRAFERGMAQIVEEIEPFARFLEEQQVRRVLEIGTEKGGTATLWLELGCVVVSVDMPGGYWKGLQQTAADHAARNDELVAAYGDRFTPVAGDSHARETIEEVERVLAGQPVDLLFIDGDHSYSGARADWTDYRRFVRPGGFVAFHDIAGTEYHRSLGCEVDRVWAEIAGDKMEFSAGGQWGGIGLVQLEGGPRILARRNAVSVDTVLVACPTFAGKHYALDAYLRAYNAFMYPHRGLFMVDNTATGHKYYDHLVAHGVPCEHIDATVDFQETFSRCWQRIARYAREHGYKWIASIEQDNICPPIALDALLNVAGYCRALHVAHSYPWHGTQAAQGRLLGLGCNLIDVEMLNAIFDQTQWFTNAFEGEVYEYPKLMGYPTVELHNLFEVRHLDDEQSAEYFVFRQTQPLPKLGTPADEQKPPVYQKVAGA